MRWHVVANDVPGPDDDLWIALFVSMMESDCLPNVPNWFQIIGGDEIRLSQVLGGDDAQQLVAGAVGPNRSYWPPLSTRRVYGTALNLGTDSRQILF